MTKQRKCAHEILMNGAEIYIYRLGNKRYDMKAIYTVGTSPDNVREERNWHHNLTRREVFDHLRGVYSGEYND